MFKITKNHQIKKVIYLQKQPKYRNTPVPDIIRKKWVINLSSKPLSNGEQLLLQKGPKFAVSSSKVPLTKYIAVTKRICDELGENTVGKDCTEIYQKTKEVLEGVCQNQKMHQLKNLKLSCLFLLVGKVFCFSGDIYK